MNLIEAHLRNPDLFVLPIDDDDDDDEKLPPLEEDSDAVEAPANDVDVSRYLLANVHLHKEMDTDASYLSSLLNWAGHAGAMWAIEKGASKLLGSNSSVVEALWNKYGPDWVAQLYTQYPILKPVTKMVVSKAATKLVDYARWLNQRRLTAKEAERLQQRDKRAEATGSKSKKIAKECDLPFLNLATDEQWAALFQEDMENKTRILKTRLGPMPDSTIADVYKRELNRLRDVSSREVGDLINKETCPPSNVSAWEVWIENSERIERRALDVFLDDAVVALEIEVDEASTTAVPNPVASKRKEAYANVVRNLSGLYGKTREPYADAVNLVYLRNCGIVSLERYRQAKRALDDYERNRQAREAQHQQALRIVRAHTVVAAVVGTAMARNVLGSNAPHVRILRTPELEVINDEDQSVMQGTLRSLRSTLQAGASRTTALRLGELCAIAQSVLG
jgi:hypothetical protein